MLNWLSKVFGTAKGPARDPGPSPVPWLSDEIWRAWNCKPHIACGGPIIDPRLVAVTENDRARAPSYPLPREAAFSPEGTLDEQRERLLTTPGGGRLELQVWPVCCARLATLLGVDFREIEKDTGPLDHAYLEQEIRDGWPKDSFEEVRRDGIAAVLDPVRRRKRGDDGLSFFQCRACGRVYVASYHP